MKVRGRGTPAVQARADNYFLTGASATATISKRLDVTMSAANLFDTLVERAYGFPREGRTFRLTFGGRF